MAGLDMTDPTLRQGGGGLGLGDAEARTADTMGEAAAYSESARNQYNAHVGAQNAIGIHRLAGVAGAVAGTAIGGPVGGSLGGSLASLAAGAFKNG